MRIIDQGETDLTLEERIDGAARMMVRMMEGGESGAAITSHLAETIAKRELRREQTDAEALEFDDIFNAKAARILDEISSRALALRPDLFQELRIERIRQEF